MGLCELHEVRSAQRRRRVAAAVEELLPLANHAEIAVVDDGHVDLDPLLRAGGELGGGHLEAAVADDDPHFFLGVRELRADRGGKGEAHRPEAARRDELPRVVVLVVLRFPHLVLADVGHDEGLALRDAPEVVHHVRGVQVARRVRHRLDVADRRVALQLVDLLDPRLAVATAHDGHRACASVSATSPMSGTSTRTFLLISAGSSSQWIFFARFA